MTITAPGQPTVTSGVAAQPTGQPSTPPQPELRVWRAGTVDYLTAWDEQRQLHAARVADQGPDTVMLLEHPSVYTAGKRTEPADRPIDGAEVIDVDRGGKITWHGPGQLVGYPITKLPDPVDVVAYVRRVEAMLIDVCAAVGLTTTRIKGRSGVWVVPEAADSPDPSRAVLPGLGSPARKVAAIGIRVSRGVTLHGFSLNCDCDLDNYHRIVPCGIRDASVTSLSAELGRTVTVSEVLPLVEQRIGMVLG